MITLVTILITFFAAWILVPIILGLIRLFGVFTTIEECETKVYVLFGKVILILDEPGLHFLWTKLGLQSFIVHFFGQVHSLDMRLDQQYLRSQPVNSEEGTPMGVGVWHEMSISDPVAFLFKNTDPRGSLRANLSNAAVRCLSNMPLERLLENRHEMSRAVREEVSPKSAAWGYKLGSVYIRKVHFRDQNMIHQIEQKVINRLRQVTSAISQSGANQVALIKSAAEKEAAAEFARAGAMRPFVVGTALQQIAEDPEILNALFEIMETQKMLEGDVDLTLIPKGENSNFLAEMLAAKNFGNVTGTAPPPLHA
ncbi:MAG: SPFH domain-containing protein [Blastochloris sp.]|nr:SPFH domain-containing protein [Blastochloris sp.]